MAEIIPAGTVREVTVEVSLESQDRFGGAAQGRTTDLGRVGQLAEGPNSQSSS